MKNSNLNLAQYQALEPVMTVVSQKSNELKTKKNPKMIRIYVEDFNNHPISYANVKLTSGEFSTNLKFDKETRSYVSRKFASDRYDLEVTADFFEPHFNNFYVPKSGINRIVCLAKG